MRQIVMDCDPGWDDCLALRLLLDRKNNLNVRISTTWGNAEINETTSNAALMMGYCGPSDDRVFRGAKTALGKARKGSAVQPVRWDKLMAIKPTPARESNESAFEMLVRTADESMGQLTVLATGPLTNIASAILKNPAVMKKIDLLIVIGGAFADSTTNEFNLAADETATSVVLKAGLNTVLVPFETCEKMRDVYDLKKIMSKGTKRARFYCDVVDDQVKQGNAQAAQGLFDQLGALYAIKPELFYPVERKVRIEYSEKALGKIVPDDKAGDRVLLAMDLDKRAAFDLLCYRLDFDD